MYVGSCHIKKKIMNRERTKVISTRRGGKECSRWSMIGTMIDHGTTFTKEGKLKRYRKLRKERGSSLTGCKLHLLCRRHLTYHAHFTMISPAMG